MSDEHALDALAPELEDLFNVAFLLEIGGYEEMCTGALDSAALRELGVSGWHNEASVDVDEYLDGPYTLATNVTEFPGLKNTYKGSSPSVCCVGEDPPSIFLYFMPITSWNNTATESNRYHHQMIDERTDAWFAKQKKCPGELKYKSKRDIKTKLQQMPPIRAFGFCTVLVYL